MLSFILVRVLVQAHHFGLISMLFLLKYVSIKGPYLLGVVSFVQIDHWTSALAVERTKELFS